MTQEFLGITAALTAIIAARYLLLSGLFYWLLWQRGGERLRARRLNRERPMRRAIHQEIRLSLLSSVIYAAPASAAIVAFMHGLTRIYTGWTAFGGVPYLFLSAFIYLAIQDTFYYFAHRAMHRPALFRWMHAGHHRSRQPTPFASFAFDPAEAVLTAWLLPALTFIVPIHLALATGILLLISTTAVLNHSGWETLPSWLVRGPLGNQLISATHHSYHHLRFDRNYGLHFRFWDKVMGTDAMPQIETPANLAPAVHR